MYISNLKHRKKSQSVSQDNASQANNRHPVWEFKDNSDLIVLLSKPMGVLLLISNIATVCIGWNLTVGKSPFLHLRFYRLTLPVHNCGVLFSCQLKNFLV